MAIEIADLPNYKMVIFHRFLGLFTRGYHDRDILHTSIFLRCISGHVEDHPGVLRSS